MKGLLIIFQLPYKKSGWVELKNFHGQVGEIRLNDGFTNPTVATCKLVLKSFSQKPAIKSEQMVKFANCRWQDGEITSKDYFTIGKLKN